MTTELKVNGAVVKEKDRVVALTNSEWTLGTVVDLDSSRLPIFVENDDGNCWWCEADKVYKYSYAKEVGAPVLVIKPIEDFEEEFPVGSVAYIGDASELDADHDNNYLTNNEVDNAPLYEDEYNKHIVFITYDESTKTCSHDERTIIINEHISHIREIRKERQLVEAKQEDLEHERRALVEQEVQATSALNNQIKEWLEED